MELPKELLRSLEGVEGFDERRFTAVHETTEQVTSIRVNPYKQFSPASFTSSYAPVPWTSLGFYLEKRPSFTFDPLFHAGCYYVQDASSMFLEQAFKQTVNSDGPIRILDLSAAPGGKSTHLQSIMPKGSLLVSNEVIRSRTNVLKDNIIKWGCDNVTVTNNDPADFAILPNYFDVIIVDAPCSGSGLFRKDADAIMHWSKNNVALCSQRQQRILADVIPALKENGILIYSTCSYSREEDEDIGSWLVEHLGLQPVQLELDRSWHVVETTQGHAGWGYRFWPDRVKGEGFYISCYRKTVAGSEHVRQERKARVSVASTKQIEVIQQWIGKEGYRFINHSDTIYAWPEHVAADMEIVLSRLKLIYSGVELGQMMRDKMVPAHALAMSDLLEKTHDKIELDLSQAIRYLQRKDPELSGGHAGWKTVSYEGHTLGWINVLHNRVNNYYPKEMRILRERADF